MHDTPGHTHSGIQSASLSLTAEGLQYCSQGAHNVTWSHERTHPKPYYHVSIHISQLQLIFHHIQIWSDRHWQHLSKAFYVSQMWGHISALTLKSSQHIWSSSFIITVTKSWMTPEAVSWLSPSSAPRTQTHTASDLDRPCDVIWLIVVTALGPRTVVK